MIKSTYRYIKNNCDWDEACNVMGWNPWMFNEGLCSDEDECYITFEQARQIGVEILLSEVVLNE
jgi:hypothetical protein